MSARITRLAQPGPVAAERTESLAGHVRSLDFMLEPGLTINEAIARPLVGAGLACATLTLEGGALAPFTYVMPALSPDAEHAAWFSAEHQPAGVTRLERANVTFGERDGAPFVHIHGLWVEADGRRRGGHMMPHATVVAAPIRARAWGFADVGIRADLDPETNFTLFHPVPVAAAAGAQGRGPRGLVARIRPNEDVSLALEALCRRHGFAAAVVRGSVGSIIGAVFEDAPSCDDIATELLVLDGEVAPGADGAPRARLDIALVDTAGVIHQGRLRRGENPVCITFELVLEERPPA